MPEEGVIRFALEFTSAGPVATGSYRVQAIIPRQLDGLMMMTT
jgi:hypothetical protein